MKKISSIFLVAFLVGCNIKKVSDSDRESKVLSVRKDKDQDGIINRLDKCKDVSGPVENNGCPWPDSDSDGVPDKDDQCKDIAGSLDNNGCQWPDTDVDGILDKDDACPTVPGLPEYNGCPKPKASIASEVVMEYTILKSSKTYPVANNKKNITSEKEKQIDYSDEEYNALIENPFELTNKEPMSTFSIDVDNASYSNIRRMINYGNIVDKNAVRIEEMVNYFKYDYPQPQNNQPFSINTEYSDSPWNPKHKLLKIGLQGKNIPMNNLPPSNIIFLIDTSGSMSDANKLPLLKESFKILLNQLRSKDKVGIVAYAGSAGVILSPTSASEKNKIMEAFDQLEAGGSTAGGEGIKLAYKLAQENFIKGGNNRVVLATDGDFNVGISSAADLETLIEEKRKTGIFLTCLGYGMGNYKDNKLETLADKGNGNYAYIDNLTEANRFLGREFAGSIYTIAKDVKIQVEFNPKHVKSYRLIGYENRKLRNEDFENDKIDAGELGSGHTVTALYEIIPANVNSEFIPKTPKLKYSSTVNTQNFGDELATIKFRYKKPDGDKSLELKEIVKNLAEPSTRSGADYKFASAVAWFGLILRQSDLIKEKDLNKVISLAKEGKNNDEEGYRSEFVRLVESYKSVGK